MDKAGNRCNGAVGFFFLPSLFRHTKPRKSSRPSRLRQMRLARSCAGGSAIFALQHSLGNGTQSPKRRFTSWPDIDSDEVCSFESFVFHVSYSHRTPGTARALAAQILRLACSWQNLPCRTGTHPQSRNHCWLAQVRNSIRSVSYHTERHAVCQNQV